MVQILKDRKLFLGIYAIIAIIAGLILLLIEKGDAIIYVAKSRNYIFNLLFRFMSFVVETWVFIILSILLFLKDYRNSLLVGGAGLLTLFITGWLKVFFSMPRPMIYFENMDRLQDLVLVPEYEALTGYSSFPSGHATAAFALMFALSIISNKKWVDVLTLTIAVLAAFSRIYLTNHFLMDVLAGSILGILISLFLKVILDSLKLPKWSPFKRDKISA